MDMRLTTVHVSPNVPIRTALLLLLAYPFFVVILARARRSNSGIVASVLPAVLFPLFVSSAAAWLGMTHLLQGLSVSGAGRIASSAGVAETFAITTFGALIAALISIAALLFVGRSSLDAEQGRPPSKVAWMLSFGLVTLCAMLISLHIAVSSSVVEQVPTWLALRGLYQTVFLAGIAAVGGIVSLAWLVLSRRRADLQFRSSRRAISACAAIGASVLAYLSWHFMTLFQGVAMHG